jgi:hypothetical protein
MWTLLGSMSLRQANNFFDPPIMTGLTFDLRASNCHREGTSNHNSFIRKGFNDATWLLVYLCFRLFRLFICRSAIITDSDSLKQRLSLSPRNHTHSHATALWSGESTRVTKLLQSICGFPRVSFCPALYVIPVNLKCFQQLWSFAHVLVA